MQDGGRILVAGAGPAGLSCAYWAAKEGHEVTVFERDEKLAIKPCGEFIPGETLRYTPFSRRAPWILNKIERGLIYYKSEFVRELHVAPLNGYTIDKRAFLDDFAAEAEALGATVRLGEKLTYRDLGDREFDLAVDATGYPHSLARAAGLDYPNQRLAVSMQGYCRGEMDSDAVTLNLSDRGYAWLIPRGDLINFGVGGFYGKAALEKAFEENLELFNLKLAAGAPPSRTTLSLVGGPIKRLRKGKLVVAGEAAGAIMSTTGEGIKFSLWSGSTCFKENYERLFWRGYGERLKLGGKLLKLALRMSDEERLKLLKRGPPKLHETLLEGFRPGIRDVVAMPWLLRYLIKLYMPA